MNKEERIKAILDAGYIVTRDDVLSPNGHRYNDKTIRLYIKGSNKECGKNKTINVLKTYIIFYNTFKIVPDKIKYKDGNSNNLSLSNLIPYYNIGATKTNENTTRNDFKYIVKGTKNYIDDLDLIYEIMISNGKGKPTDKLEKMLMLISKNVIRKFRFKDETWRDDCINASNLQLFTNWHNFNPDKHEKSLPYFSEISKRAIAKCFNELMGYKLGNQNQGKFDTISINEFYY